MRKFLIALLAAVLFAASCAGNTVPPPTPEPPLRVPEEGVVPMSFMLKAAQADFVRGPFNTWFTECAGSYFTGALKYYLKTTDWRKDNMTFTTLSDPGTILITFTGISAGKSAFDPALSTWIYGKTTVTSNTDGEIGGSAYLLDNSRNDTVLDFSQDEEIDLHQERSTSTGTEISLDVGSKTTGTVGGDAAGAKLEVEVSAAFGVKTDTTTAESESTDTKTSRHIATTVEPARSTLASITASNIVSHTPFDANLVWESGITVRAATSGWIDLTSDCTKTLIDNDAVTYEGDWKEGRGYVTITWDSWDEFSSMVNGVNVDWPTYTCPSGNAWRCSLSGVALINDPANRHVIMSGVQSRIYQGSAEVSIVDVTGQDLDALVKKHGIDDDHVVTGNSQLPGFNEPQGEVPRFAVTENGIIVLHDDGVIRSWDLIGERTELEVPLAYDPEA